METFVTVNKAYLTFLIVVVGINTIDGNLAHCAAQWNKVATGRKFPSDSLRVSDVEKINNGDTCGYSRWLKYWWRS
ncbi:hypothetical protein LHA01_04900 [Schleiferilactobacillus harbinensis]|nr:hypothetical protein LHA01_04900 [Schleiferilactobacillus harbinensis]